MRRLVTGDGLTPAERAGCCRAKSKETCKRPPCPCNMEAWTPQERDDLAAEARKRGARDLRP